jgi:uncharacterized protein DUF11
MSRHAVAAGGGNVVFDSGTWTMSEPGLFTPGFNFSSRMSVPCAAPTELCGVSWYGIIVPVNVNLVGQGATASVDVGVAAASSVAGSTSTYTVQVTNYNTTAAASAVTLIIEPGAGVTINPGSYSVPGSSTCDSSVNVCSLGSLSASHTMTISFTASLASSGTAPVAISVTHRDADPVAANDSVSL